MKIINELKKNYPISKVDMDYEHQVAVVSTIKNDEERVQLVLSSKKKNSTEKRSRHLVLEEKGFKRTSKADIERYKESLKEQIKKVEKVIDYRHVFNGTDIDMLDFGYELFHAIKKDHKPVLYTALTSTEMNQVKERKDKTTIKSTSILGQKKDSKYKKAS